MNLLGAFDLGLDDLNKALIGARRGEAQSRDEASPAQRVGEFALLGCESAGDHAAEGSRRSDCSDRERKHRRGGPAEHGIRRHLVALWLLVRVLEEGFGAIAYSIQTLGSLLIFVQQCPSRVLLLLGLYAGYTNRASWSRN